jgi:hypothetical protein
MPLTPDKISSHLMSLKSPSSIILTLNPVNFSITMTHHHGTLGLSVNGSLHCIALTGMHSQAHPVILAMNHLFASTKETHCISLYDVMLETANKLLSILKNLQPFKGVRNYTHQSCPPTCLFLPSCPQLYMVLSTLAASCSHQTHHIPPLLQHQQMK